jgi:hypothetical protein
VFARVDVLVEKDIFVLLKLILSKSEGLSGSSDGIAGVK